VLTDPTALLLQLAAAVLGVRDLLATGAREVRPRHRRLSSLDSL
jgi:hypothetical protein